MCCELKKKFYGSQGPERSWYGVRYLDLAGSISFGEKAPISSNRYFRPALGYDASGVIESVGPDVRTVRVGDRVSTFPAVSLQDYPAHAEAVIYPENALFAYPHNLAWRNWFGPPADSAL